MPLSFRMVDILLTFRWSSGPCLLQEFRHECANANGSLPPNGLDSRSAPPRQDSVSQVWNSKIQSDGIALLRKPLTHRITSNREWSSKSVTRFAPLPKLGGASRVSLRHCVPLEQFRTFDHQKLHRRYPYHGTDRRLERVQWLLVWQPSTAMLGFRLQESATTNSGNTN